MNVSDNNKPFFSDCEHDFSDTEPDAEKGSEEYEIRMEEDGKRPNYSSDSPNLVVVPNWAEGIIADLEADIRKEEESKTPKKESVGKHSNEYLKKQKATADKGTFKE